MSDEKPKSIIRQLLESGPTDPRLMEKLKLLEELQAAHARNDHKAMLDIGRKLATNAADIEQAQQQRRDAMAQVVAHAKATTDPSERTAAFLSAFQFCVKEACAADEESRDIDTYNFGVRQLRSIGDELRAIDRFPALAQFLDSADVQLRGFAAVWLKGIMPEQVLPILREVNKTEKFGSPVGTQVHFAISELKRKMTGNSTVSPIGAQKEPGSKS